MIDEHTPIPPVEPLLRQAMHTAFGGVCFYTGREITLDTMHVDHIVPKVRGGMDCIANYVPCCSDFNQRKAASVHHDLTAVTLEAVRSVYAKKVVCVFKVLLGAGRYPRTRGRPYGSLAPDEQRQDAMIRERVTQAARAKYERLGGKDWLLRQLDRASEPSSQPPT